MKTSVLSILLLGILTLTSGGLAAAVSDDEDPIQIVEGKDRRIYEYRQNGVLIMIKVVPKDGLGLPYYMVPADGSAHFESLDHKKKLYPKWVILEW